MKTVSLNFRYKQQDLCPRDLGSIKILTKYSIELHLLHIYYHLFSSNSSVYQIATQSKSFWIYFEPVNWNPVDKCNFKVNMVVIISTCTFHARSVVFTADFGQVLGNHMTANIYLFKINNRNTKKRCEMRLTLNIFHSFFSVFILLLTLNT